jgi:hypothetical protein
MLEIYKIYYRGRGVRYATGLLDLKKPPVDKLSRDAIYHCYEDERGDGNPDASLSFFAGYNKKILLHTVSDYINPIGNFKKPPFLLNEVTRSWRKVNLKHWQFEQDAWKKTSSPEQLVVINYGYLDKAHRYIKMMMTPFHAWRNRWSTIFATINQVANESPRHQFVEIPVPEYLQGKTILDRYVTREINPTAMTIFGAYSPDGFMQLELWKWLSVQHRKESLLGVIEPKNYSKVNFIFRGKSGQSVVVNLAYLNSWIKDQPNQTEMSTVVQLPFETIQKLYLKFCMLMNNVAGDETGEEIAQQAIPVKTPEATQDEPEEKKADQVEDGVETDGFEIAQEEDTEETSAVGPIMSPVAKDSGGDKVLQVKDANFEEFEKRLADLESKNPTNFAADILLSIEEDIEALDHVSMVQLKNRGVNVSVQEEEAEAEVPEKELQIDPEEIKAKVLAVETPTEKLARMISQDAEANLITAAEYRKMQQDIQAYSTTKDPYGTDKPRKEAMVIKPEDLVFSKEAKDIPLSDSVPDKTMGASSLQAFNKQYVKNVMRKDVLAAVDGLQSAGVIIRNHEVNISTTALGTYENHKLELKPIDGKPSTISFTLPVVNKDGTFLAGGNKYLMRKQRVD